MTLFGTRPEIIRLSLIIKTIDQQAEQVLVHTGQNFDDGLSGLFLRDLKIRDPDYHLGIRSETFADQVAQILVGVDRLLGEVKPDRLLILGDTNSGLAALVAARKGIPVYHLEAGNRCYDNRVPEEINRRVIDHSSDVLMPYTHRSKENLIREGIAREKLFVVGNPINEVMTAFGDQIQASQALIKLGVEPQGYMLATVHRAENVDIPSRLANVVESFDRITERWGLPIVVSTHPRMADKLQRFGITPRSSGVRFVEPMGFFDFGLLQRNARCVLTDSGTVQEESCILHVANVTVRDVTERPETVECGSNILAGVEPDAVEAAVAAALDSALDWEPPAEYLVTDVSRVVTELVLGVKGEGAGADVEPAAKLGQ
jgi:UDP-N-acetylglucosamine 2-epimerase (non-hydrolysing)